MTKPLIAPVHLILERLTELASEHELLAAQLDAAYWWAVAHFDPEDSSEPEPDDNE